MVFDPSRNLHVTAQDTNVSLRHYGPRATAGKPGAPMPHPSALAGQTQALALHPGTFCPSAREFANGLVVVREALFAKNVLYVADRDGDCIRKYDPVGGEYLGTLAAKGVIDKPIHLALRDDMIYVGNKGNESIARYDLKKGHLTTFIVPRSGGLRDSSGLAFDSEGYFYVASRGSRQILRYRLQDGTPDKKTFIDRLADDPEFIELVARN